MITGEEPPAPKLVRAGLHLLQEQERMLSWMDLSLGRTKLIFFLAPEAKVGVVCFKASLHSCDCGIRGEEEPKSQPGQALWSVTSPICLYYLAQMVTLWPETDSGFVACILDGAPAWTSRVLWSYARCWNTDQKGDLVILSPPPGPASLAVHLRPPDTVSLDSKKAEAGGLLQSLRPTKAIEQDMAT